MRQNKFFMKKKSTADKQFGNIEQGLNQGVNKTEEFIQNNQSTLLASLTIIILIIIGSFLWNSSKTSKNREAQTNLFEAEQYFEKNQFQLALEGNEEFQGFLQIIDEYSNTETAQLATYYAGICYLRTGDFQNAIQMLDAYESNDPILLQLATMNIASAFSEIQQPKEAIEYYKKAIKINSNELITPKILMKCGTLYELEGDFEQAAECYKTIHSEYPESAEAENIEKYIQRVSFK